MQQKTDSTNNFSYLFNNLLHKSTIIFYHCSLEEDFPVVFISENVEEILGYRPEEFYSDSTFWVDRINPEDREEVEQSFLNILNEQRRVYEYRFRHKDGSELWLRDENTVTFDEHGNPQAITGTAINISGRKKAEQKIKKLNETLEQRIEERTRDLTLANRKLKKQIQYRNKAELKLNEQQKRLKILQMAVANINDMVIITRAPVDDPLNSKIVFVNDAFERLTGYKKEEVKEKNPTFLHGEGTDNNVISHINKKILNHESLRTEFVNYKKNGTPYWVELVMSPFPAEEDGYKYWVGINRDITQRKKAEKNLEESEYRYRAYTELSFDAIFEISLDGTITDCNARASEMFGYSRNELIGMNTKKLTPKKYRSIQPEVFSDEITTGNEIWERKYRHKDGSIIQTAINTQMYTRSGEQRLIAYVRDITDQKEYEQAIQKSLKEKEVLLAEIHHRVKNNLAIISGLLEMQIFNSGNEALINELKESQFRIQSIAMVHEKLYQSESFSDVAIDSYINELLEFISDSFDHEDKNITVHQQVEATNLNVNKAIPCGLILNELITNSYKHAFKHRNEGTINISLTEADSQITLLVQDDGPGLPNDFDISNPSSLGMTLIQTLIDQLDGTLDIESDNGTTFRVEFDSSPIT